MAKRIVTGRVAVIVTTRNSADHLELCLKSIRNQTYPDVELIVVDNESTDETTSIARRFAGDVFTAGPERSAQRNIGVRRSTGDFVLVIDSDMELTPQVVEECAAAVSADHAAAAIVPETSIGEGFWARCRALERSCYVGDDTIEAARFFTREAFERHGGYDESLTGPEDWDLPARMRSTERIVRVAAHIVHHEGRLSLLPLLRKKYYYGRAFAPYIRRHPRLASRQLLIVRPAFLRHRGKLLRDPRHAVGMIAMKTLEFAAGGLGMAAANLKRARPS